MLRFILPESQTAPWTSLEVSLPLWGSSALKTCFLGLSISRASWWEKFAITLRENVCVCICICLCVCVYMYMHVCTCVRTYACICVYMCMHVLYICIACECVCAQIYQTARLCHDYINDFSHQCDKTSGQSNLREEDFIWAPASETSAHREGQLTPLEAGAAQAGIIGAKKKCSHVAPTGKPRGYSSQRRVRLWTSMTMSLNGYESQWLWVSTAISTKPFPAANPHLLKGLWPPKTAPLAGDQAFKHRHLQEAFYNQTTTMTNAFFNLWQSLFCSAG